MISLTNDYWSSNQDALEEYYFLILIGKNYAEVPELKHGTYNEPRYLC